MKRLKAVLSLALLLCFMLSAIGCENVEYIDKSQTDESSQGFYEQLESQLPDLSQEEGVPVVEQSFSIVTDKASVFYNEETTSGSLNIAVNKRNEFLKEKYGAIIEVREVSPNRIINEMKTALESDTEYADLFAISGNETVRLYTAGLLTDISKLPNFNVESEYFDQRIAKTLATNSSLYLLPDASAQYYDEIFVMYFNRTLVNEQAQKDIELLVSQGKWTWDAFNEAAKAAAPKVYNKSSADIENDIFGFGSYYGEGNYPLVLWASAGHKLVDNTYKNGVALSMSVQEIQDIASKLVKSYNTRGKYPLDGNNAMNTFQNGRIAFFCNKMSYFYALRDGKGGGNQYGFVPMPKLNEEQSEYNSLVAATARVYAVPKTVENDSDARKAFVSAVLQATCASGSVTIHDAYIANYIGNYLNNNTETLMLQAVLDSATFDFATVYGNYISEIRKPTTTAIADYLDFGSALSSSINRALPGFDKYCSQHFK